MLALAQETARRTNANAVSIQQSVCGSHRVRQPARDQVADCTAYSPKHKHGSGQPSVMADCTIKDNSKVRINDEVPL